jgi:hypothetical protein
MPSGANFNRQLGENFTHDQHGTPAGAIFAEGIDNLRLKPSRSAAASRKINVIANAFTERSVAAIDR